MTTVEKINYMIACLQIAKEEAEYLEHYKEREQKVSEDHDKWWSWYCKNRVPNTNRICCCKNGRKEW